MKYKKFKISYIDPITNQKVTLKFKINPKVEPLDFSGLDYDALQKLLVKEGPKLKKSKGILSVKENALSLFKSLIKVSENNSEKMEKSLVLIELSQLETNISCLLNEEDIMWNEDETFNLEYDMIEDEA